MIVILAVGRGVLKAEIDIQRKAALHDCLPSLLGGGDA